MTTVGETRSETNARLKKEIAWHKKEINHLVDRLEPPTPLEQAVTLLEQVVAPPSPDWLLIDKIREFLEGDE